MTRLLTKKIVAWALALLVVLFVGINVMLYNHAYHFTHFAPAGSGKTGRPEALSFRETLSVAFSGVRNPKPENLTQPEGKFEVVTFQNQSGKGLESWLIRTEGRRGTVLMFHGYTATKSQLLAEAEAFREMGFNTLLVDLSGHGGSDGNVTTIGYNEAADVVAAYQLVSTTDDTIILYGVSMGAAAVLRAVAVYDLQPQALLLECPFGSMVQAVRNRFRLMRLPDFSLAEMLVFWGGVQNDYPAFAHNPSEYARQVKVPTLLMYGLRDQRVIKSEVEEIYRNLPGPKEVVYFEELAHEFYLKKQPRHWKAAINDFLLHTKEINHDL